jgi:uncharacterized protein
MNTQQLSNAFTIFLSLLVEALPFLLLGVLFSGLLLLFVDERRLISLLPKHPLLGALVGAAIGCFFPVCECGNVPVARRLLMQGVPISVAMSFLLAAPTINPIVIWATWTAFRDQPEIVVLRIVFSLLIATGMGLVFSVQKDLSPILQPSVLYRVTSTDSPRSNQPASIAELTSPLLKSGTYWLQSSPVSQTSGATDAVTDVVTLQAALISSDTIAQTKPLYTRLPLFLETVVQELQELGGVLVIGSAIAAILQTYVPRDVILGLGQGPVTSIAATMLLAGMVSICSTVDAFFALSFASTFTTGSVLAFLVFGPMIDLKGLGLMWSIFRTRAIIYLFAISALMTFLLTLLINLHFA